MSWTAAARARSRRTPGPPAVGLVVAVATIMMVLGYQSASASFLGGQHGGHGRTAWQADGAVNEADGVLPDDVTVLDNQHPGIANLDPALLQALREAATRAADDRVEFFVHSAWRSPEYQSQLLREAIAQYGSRKKAARWVADPDTSAHVSGQAIDLESEASTWLSRHGAHYGLCRIYRNEPWHYQLRPAAIDHGCPARYADPTQDPRMQR